jgi:predicted oxidoreductase
VTRREFLKLIGFAGATALVAPDILRGAAAFAQQTTSAPIPRRALGKTGHEISIIGCGCSSLGDDEEAAVAILNRAIDLGITYIDTAPSYMGTRSEQIVGRVMANRRDQVWLTTKTLERTRDKAAGDIDQSLKRLRTDHVDALLLHAVNTETDVKRVLAKEGAVRALEEEKRAGRIRAIGVSSHHSPEVAVRLLDEYPFEIILIPIGIGEQFYLEFADTVIPKAKQTGTAVVGMMCLDAGAPGSNGKAITDALALDVATVIVEMRTMAEVEQNAHIAAGFRAPSEAEREKLLEQMSKLASPQTPWWKR